MSGGGLHLDLNPGETLLIEGMRLVARGRCRFTLVTHARFVVSHQYIDPTEAAESREGRFLWLMQTAYAGPADEEEGAIDEARALAPKVGGGEAAIAAWDAGKPYRAWRTAWECYRRGSIGDPVAWDVGPEREDGLCARGVGP